MNALEHSIRLASRETILSGDFNAHAQAWGSSRMDQRGEALLEMAESLGLILANDGQVPTFPHSNSFLDLTFATRGAFRALGRWEVLDLESMRLL